MAAQVIRWAIFFSAIFIFQGTLTSHVLKNPGKCALGIKTRFKCNTQKRDMIVSRVLHFPGYFRDAIFVNQIIKAFFEHGVNDPG